MFGHPINFSSCFSASRESKRWRTLANAERQEEEALPTRRTSVNSSATRAVRGLRDSNSGTSTTGGNDEWVPHENSTLRQKTIGTVTVAFDRALGRVSYPIHNRLYRLTRGLIGHRSPAGPMLLLTSTGAKSGLARTNAVLYMEHGGHYFIVASNGGRPTHPNWLHNVRRHPHVTVQAGAKRFEATAHVLDADERSHVWPRLTAFYPGWAHYETLTTRTLQVVRLEPTG